MSRMSKKNVFLYITLLLIILSILRLGWMYYYNTFDHPKAKNGVIDLSTYTFEHEKTVTLNGEWEFYPNQFIYPYNNKSVRTSEKKLINVPSNWDNMDSIDHPFGFGTYRLTILIPNKRDRIYGLRIKSIDTAANVYVDGSLIYEHGSPSESVSNAKGSHGPFSFLFKPDNNEVELLIHVSNYDNPLQGGITSPITIGLDTAIQIEDHRSKTLQTVVSMIYFLHGMYAFFLYFLGKRKYEKEYFFFGFMLFLHGFTVLIDDDIVLLLPISFVWSHKLLIILFISTLFTLLVFIKHTFNLQSAFFKWLTVIYIALFIITLATSFFFVLMFGMFLFYILSFFFLFFHTIRIILQGDRGAIFILIFITSYTSNMIWGGLINLNVVEIPFYPFDFLISVIAIALLLFVRQIRLYEENEKYTLQLQKADILKDEFLANTSHEIRNPLHSIINIAQSILDNEKLSEESKENLHLLIRVGNKMNFTLNDLSTVTQLKDGKVSLNKNKVNLHVITAFVLDMLQFMKEGKKINLYSKIPINFPNLFADENRLVQILFNLVHNAIKYTEEGSIVVSAEYSNKVATIYVKDTGVGITAPIEEIFKPYVRATSEQHRFTAGIGVGLNVVKQLVELHDGTISYQTTKEGTTFMFTIPLADERVVPPIENDPSMYVNEVAATNKRIDRIPTLNHEIIDPANKATILVTDDDAVNVKVLQQVLEYRYNVMTAFSAKEALEKIDQHRIDLVISDVMMPYMSGYELTVKIREKFTVSELPILLITARDLPEDIHVAFESGANDYLIKPVNALELKARVKSLTDLKRSVKELLRFEAAWLQAQIHPHFLFNTLNSIASLAEIDTDRMVNLLQAFGSYLEKSFSITNVEPEIPLENELDLTRVYIHIEKERFGDRVQIEYDIDEKINILIPPLCIQPLVENAIIHGILKKLDGGTVLLKIKDHPDEVSFVIKDNGVGMDQKKVNELLTIHHSVLDGVGVANTNRRLIQLYGKGLSIQSVPNKGTTVQFRIPKITK